MSILCVFFSGAILGGGGVLKCWHLDEIRPRPISPLSRQQTNTQPIHMPLSKLYHTITYLIPTWRRREVKKIIQHKNTKKLIYARFKKGKCKYRCKYKLQNRHKIYIKCVNVCNVFILSFITRSQQI